MKTILTLFVAGIMLLVTVGVLATPASGGDKQPVLIGFNGEPNEKLVKQYGGEITSTFTLTNTIAANLPSKSIDPLAKNENIAYVELDGEVKVQEGESLPWGVDRIDAELVHPDYTGAGIKIALIDSGIDYNHPDLDDNYVRGYDFVNDDNDPMDDAGHGTMCAGVIVAERNDLGVIGVAPEASLYALKVLNENGGGFWSDVVAAIEWSIRHRMDIISMSLGGENSAFTVEMACERANEAGIVVIAAAGNSGNSEGTGDNVLYPAKYSSVIAVSATDSNDQRWYKSSTGPAVELAAPGVDIETTYPGNSYRTGRGTSLSCPHVTGVAALVLSAEPTLTNTELREHLQNTAEDLGSEGKDDWYGYGLVDAEEAVNAPKPSSKVMHISSIDMWHTVGKKNYRIYTKVTIVDSQGIGVKGASVSVTLTSPTLDESSYSRKTARDGTVTFRHRPVTQKGTYTSTVTNVVKTGWKYDTSADVETFETETIV